MKMLILNEENIKRFNFFLTSFQSRYQTNSNYISQRSLGEMNKKKKIKNKLFTASYEICRNDFSSRKFHFSGTIRD